MVIIINTYANIKLFLFNDGFEYIFDFIAFPGIYQKFDISWKDVLRTLKQMAYFPYSVNIRGSYGDISWTSGINLVVRTTF